MTGATEKEQYIFYHPVYKAHTNNTRPRRITDMLELLVSTQQSLLDYMGKEIPEKSQVHSEICQHEVRSTPV